MKKEIENMIKESNKTDRSKYIKLKDFIYNFDKAFKNEIVKQN